MSVALTGNTIQVSIEIRAVPELLQKVLGAPLIWELGTVMIDRRIGRRNGHRQVRNQVLAH